MITVVNIVVIIIVKITIIANIIKATSPPVLAKYNYLLSPCDDGCWYFGDATFYHSFSIHKFDHTNFSSCNEDGGKVSLLNLLLLLYSD